jgi:hypothetical protein
MMRDRILLILTSAVAFACSESGVPPTAQSDGPTLQAIEGNPVVHQASVGSPDICTPVGDKPGCDANFSLTALQRADGSVTGEWVDRTSQVNGGGGVHVVVNCLNVIGNRAYLSGVITQGGSDQIGQLALTKVVDNGSSTKDPPDEISFTINFPGLTTDCNGAPAFDNVIPLFAIPQAQVVVR